MARTLHTREWRHEVTGALTGFNLSDHARNEVFVLVEFGEVLLRVRRPGTGEFGEVMAGIRLSRGDAESLAAALAELAEHLPVDPEPINLDEASARVHDAFAIPEPLGRQ